MEALQRHHMDKREYTLGGGLKDMDFKIQSIPNSTFYICVDLGLPSLPEKINDGLTLMQHYLERRKRPNQLYVRVGVLLDRKLIQ